MKNECGTLKNYLNTRIRQVDKNIQHWYFLVVFNLLLKFTHFNKYNFLRYEDFLRIASNNSQVFLLLKSLKWSHQGFRHHSQVALWDSNSTRLGRRGDSSCTVYISHLRTDLWLQNWKIFVKIIHYSTVLTWITVDQECQMEMFISLPEQVTSTQWMIPWHLKNSLTFTILSVVIW